MASFPVKNYTDEEEICFAFKYIGTEQMTSGIAENKNGRINNRIGLV